MTIFKNVRVDPLTGSREPEFSALPAWLLKALNKPRDAEFALFEDGTGGMVIRRAEGNMAIAPGQAITPDMVGEVDDEV